MREKRKQNALIRLPDVFHHQKKPACLPDCLPASLNRKRRRRKRKSNRRSSRRTLRVRRAHVESEEGGIVTQ